MNLQVSPSGPYVAWPEELAESYGDRCKFVLVCVDGAADEVGFWGPWDSGVQGLEV